MRQAEIMSSTKTGTRTIEQLQGVRCSIAVCHTTAVVHSAHPISAWQTVLKLSEHETWQRWGSFNKQARWSAWRMGSSHAFCVLMACVSLPVISQKHLDGFADHSTIVLDTFSPD